MELQRRYDDIRKEGLGLAAISYDAPETLKQFADSRGITFPLISDRGSAIIRAYGIFNESEKAGARGYGIPHPGTFIVDRSGRVVSRFFEEAYQERYTAATILSTLGRRGGASALSATTAHLSLTASITDTMAAPGERLSILIDVVPRRGIHVYAPGKHDYQVVRLVLTPQPWMRIHASTYPPSQIYHFKPLDERVEVYTKPFRLRTYVTILATPDVQKLLAGTPSIRIAGALEYQACDDKVCFNPASVPISFEVAIRALDRRPSGG